MKVTITKDIHISQDDSGQNWSVEKRFPPTEKVPKETWRPWPKPNFHPSLCQASVWLLTKLTDEDAPTAGTLKAYVERMEAASKAIVQALRKAK